MYPSPLRDGGYDIADFYAIHPDYGTVEDFRSFVEAAHQRGIRVIADLVMNHTSRRPPVVPGVALEPDEPEARLVRLVGHRRPLRGRADHLHRHRALELDVGPGAPAQYYWHRFFRHQPDLNYDNPEVQEAMLDVAALLARPRASTASGSTPCRTCTSATARTARTSPRRTSS